MNAVSRTMMRTAGKVAVTLYRRSGGRIGGKALGGAPVLLLTVAGRKSGVPHTTAVSYFDHQGGYVVVGSAGGTPDDPQWFKNLRKAARATVEVGSAAPARRSAFGCSRGEERDTRLARRGAGPRRRVREVRDQVRAADAARPAHARRLTVAGGPGDACRDSGSAGEGASGEPLVGLDVLGAGALDTSCRQRRAGRRPEALSQPLAGEISHSRTNSLSKDGWVWPGSHWSAGQNLDESGVSTSSASTSVVALQPELDLGVGDEDAALGGDLVAPS